MNYWQSQKKAGFGPLLSGLCYLIANTLPYRSLQIMFSLLEFCGLTKNGNT